MGLSGLRATIAVDEGATLQDLKAEIQAALPVPPWQQRLHYGTQELLPEDGDELQSLLGVEPGATVELLLVVRPEAAFDAKYEHFYTGFVDVWRGYAKERTSGRFVLQRTMRFDNDDEEEVPSSCIREVALLRRLSNHMNVVDLLDVFLSTQQMILVFEFLDNDLRRYTRSRGRFLEPATVKSFCFQLCKGIQFCHANSVLHRDLMPQRLLIDSQGRLKIAGIKLSRAYTPIPKLVHEVIITWYRPLDILLGSNQYGSPVDMWGVGCILAEMATGSPLFGGDSEIDTIFRICQKLGTPTPETWPGVQEMPHFKPTWPKWNEWDNIRNTKAQLGAVGVDLLEQFMVYDPHKRISARRALQHQYFADVVLPEGM